MGEPSDIIEELSEAGILTGVRWAYLSAAARSLEIYSEADGHDAAWLGNTRFTLFRNRLDRVFSCERYAVRPGDVPDRDVLYAELPAHDIDNMPRLDPALVKRSNLSGSPGWAYGQLRFLLASADFGRLDQLPWPRRSPTKRRVAGQSGSSSPQSSLFDGFAPDEVGGLAAALAVRHDLDLTTYIVAHTLDSVSRQAELVFGLARLNFGGGPAWHWRHDLFSTAGVRAGGVEVWGLAGVRAGGWPR